MRIQLLKSIFCAVSLIFNVIFILLFVFASGIKTAHFSFPAPVDGSSTAAALISVPPGGTAVFDLVEITLAPREEAFLQFSVISQGAQSNLIINALYDPAIISLTPTGYGIAITALRPGSTLMQAVTTNGIKDVALIIVK